MDGLTIFDRPATIQGLRKDVLQGIESRKPYGIQKLRETWTVAEATAASMRSNRGKDTQPELTLRRALWAAGLRGYRKNVRLLPGKPDVVFGRAKLAVFLHGCYWHQCPHCSRNLTPKKNAAYWDAKFTQNRERDARNQGALEALGYRVLIVWECQLKEIGAVIDQVRSLLER